MLFGPANDATLYSYTLQQKIMKHNKYIKDSSRWTFPNTLDLNPFMYVQDENYDEKKNDVVADNQSHISLHNTSNNNNQILANKYSLCSINVHIIHIVSIPLKEHGVSMMTQKPGLYQLRKFSPMHMVYQTSKRKMKVHQPQCYSMCRNILWKS